MAYAIRRSTLSDANKRRSHEVFEDIYRSLYRRYAKVLPDSSSNRLRKKLFIADSTTIQLFQEILKAAGCHPVNGKKKGGIKAHTLIKADEDVPQMVHFTAGAANDTTFLKHIALPKGSILVFDRGYNDYKQLDRFTQEGISWVTRVRKQMVIQSLHEKELTTYQHNQGVLSDTVVCLGHNFHNKITKIQARRIIYYDKINNRQFEFLTNNLDFSPLTIAQIYKQRWQIELLFKRIKQNYPLKNFLGDNENAIKIQIWCALIADLLLKVISSRTIRKWSFSNLASMIRLHLMTYIHLSKFLNHPEKALLKVNPIRSLQKQLFPT
jgi:hypothetical protein